MISPTFSYFSARLSAVFDAVRSTNSSPPYLISLVFLSFESTNVLIQLFFMIKGQNKQNGRLKKRITLKLFDFSEVEYMSVTVYQTFELRQDKFKEGIENLQEIKKYRTMSEKKDQEL